MTVKSLPLEGGSRRSRAGPLSARPAPAVPELVEGPKDVEGAALAEGPATADAVGGFQRYTVRKVHDLL